MDLTIMLEDIVEHITLINSLLSYLIIFFAIMILGGAKHYKLGTFKWKTLLLRTLEDFKYPVISIAIWCLAIAIKNNATLYSLFQLVTAVYITKNIYKALNLVNVAVTKDSIKDTQKSLMEQFKELPSNERISIIDQEINYNQSQGNYNQDFNTVTIED